MATSVYPAARPVPSCSRAHHRSAPGWFMATVIPAD